MSAYTNCPHSLAWGLLRSCILCEERQWVFHDFWSQVAIVALLYSIEGVRDWASSHDSTPLKWLRLYINTVLQAAQGDECAWVVEDWE